MKPLPLSLLLLCLSFPPLLAQEATAPATGEMETLPEVVVSAEAEPKTAYSAPVTNSASRIPENIMEVPRSVQTVTQQVIQDRAIIDPQEAVQNVSGVQRGGTFTGTGESYRLRGFAQQTYIKDGFRAGTVPGGIVYNAVAPTDVANLQQIEVLKGPASILFGRGEPGGVVNYVTQRASFEDAYSIQQMVGSFDFYRTQVNANWAAVPDKFALRFDGAFETGDSYIDYVESERTFIAPAFAWQISENTLLNFRAEYSHDDRSTIPGMPYQNGSVIGGIPYDRYLGEPGFTRNVTDTYRALLTLEHRWNEHHKTTLSLHGLTSTSEGGYFILFNFAGPLQDPVTGNIARSSAATDFSEQYLTARLDHLITWDLAPNVKNELLISAEFDYQYNDNIRKLSGHPGINPYNPVYTGYQPGPLLPFPGFPTAFAEATTTDAKAYSLLLMDKVSFGESVFLNFGARLEWFDATFESTYADPGVPFPDTFGELDQGSVNPFAGIVFKPLKQLALYGSYSESTNSFRNISLRTASGESLDPERGRQFELGAKTELLDGRFIASAAFFQINKTDISAADPNNPLFSINAGEERSRGFELDLAGELAPGWRLLMNYAYLDSRIIDAPGGANVGNRRPGVPENSGSIFTTYEIQTGRLKGLGFGGGVYMSDRVAVDTVNSGNLAGFAQTDALVFYRRNNWQVQLNVKNLFDNEIFYSADQSTSVQAGNARTFIASVKFEF
ncbi:TonB-dependent siderophore receptor [Prosthecobacter sp. SYSU 5D2]|uniref:TonB-dependent siderophore receptor n=1 Tax=Prosthecobacter sp. SYSU 5D2 TaxID=3134134 RepID=UPI0031FF00BE